MQSPSSKAEIERDALRLSSQVLPPVLRVHIPILSPAVVLVLLVLLLRSWVAHLILLFLLVVAAEHQSV